MKATALFAPFLAALLLFDVSLAAAQYTGSGGSPAAGAGPAPPPPSQTHGGSSSSSATTSSADGEVTTTTTTTTSRKHASAQKKYKGTVASIDSTNNGFVVHPALGADMTFKVNDKTKYLPKGKSWTDVAVGAKVSGTYHNDGTDNWAIVVHIWPADIGTAAKTGGK